MDSLPLLVEEEGGKDRPPFTFNTKGDAECLKQGKEVLPSLLTKAGIDYVVLEKGRRLEEGGDEDSLQKLLLRSFAKREKGASTEGRNTA